jgi:uncharacterized protein YcaQ
VRIRANQWWRQRIGNDPDAIIDQVRRRIMTEGPMQSKDFEHDNGELKPGGWWGWKPQKAALEYLWHTGELAIAARVGFQKAYDLAERVLGEHCPPAGPPLPEHEHIEWACRTALERLGVATPAEIAAFWNAIKLAQAKAWCADALRRGEIVEVLVESADGSKPRSAFARPDWRRTLQRLPDPPTPGVRLLSPFDPILRDRKRTRRLFNFDYNFEGFVPAPKRRYGYYVLPILEGERLIGRLDPKLHRDRGVLEIKGLWWEAEVKATRARRAALQDALERLASFVGAERLSGKAAARL